MMEPSDREFYLKRETQARALADGAASSGIRSIHLEMAQRYAEMARSEAIVLGRPTLKIANWSR